MGPCTGLRGDVGDSVYNESWFSSSRATTSLRTNYRSSENSYEIRQPLIHILAFTGGWSILGKVIDLLDRLMFILDFVK